MDSILNNETIKNGIFRDVVQNEIEYISYVDVETHEERVLILDKDSEVIPEQNGNYEAINEECIPKYVHPDDMEYCNQQFDLEYIKEQLKEQEQISITYRLKYLDGTYRRKQMHVRYYDSKKRILLFVRKDITAEYEREKRYQEELRAALKEAQRTNQEKSAFLARMSHEIRTPMNAIIGLTYLSKENAEVPRQVLENLDKIDASAHFLLDFINDILNLSKLESGNIAIDKNSVEMDEFLGEINRTIGKMAEEKKITYAPSVKGSIEKTYCFDSSKLKHALIKVLRNAVKFTPADGRISFVTEIGAKMGDAIDACFTITDNGIGMEKAFMERAFDAFEQEGSQDTTLAGGTGLGLTIARNIVELLGGTIRLESEKGNGTSVTIHVPVMAGKDSSYTSARTEKSTDYDFTGKRALIVEDNEVNIEIAKNILIYKNFETEVVTDGEACIKAFEEHEPGYYDVILMDIIMPVMDGLTATKIIRNMEREDSKTIPIIAMTANAFEADLKKSIDAGMNGYLSKPIDIRKMYSLLYDVLF